MPWINNIMYIEDNKTTYSWSERSRLLENDFSLEEYDRRIKHVSADLVRCNLDALLLYESGGPGSNTRYLTGFATAPTWIGASLTLVRADGSVVLVTSAVAHGEPMHSNVQTATVEDARFLATSAPGAFVAAALDVLDGWGARAVGVHGLDDLPAGLHARLTAAPAVSMRDTSHVLAAMRRIKSPAEIVVLRELGRITALGMAAAVNAVQVGASESAIAAEAHRACVAAGAELMTFGCFVATGPRSALKNVAARVDGFVEAGALTMIDLGCKYRGYQSDMSRNVVIGGADRELGHMLETCEAALAAGKKTARPGVPDVSVVQAAKNVIEAAGHTAHDYTICHSCGLDLVEEPRFDPRRPDTLAAGMSFYIEPMIIPPAVGSVCIEDMVLVTDAGCETLTEFPTHFW